MAIRPPAGWPEEAGHYGQHGEHHAQEQSRSHRGPSHVTGCGSPRSFDPDRGHVCAERHTAAAAQRGPEAKTSVVPRSASTAKTARTGPRTVVQRLSTPETPGRLGERQFTRLGG